MASDLLLPCLAAQILALPYNPNNVSEDAAPITVQLEVQVGLQLARMLGYPTDTTRPDCARTSGPRPGDRAPDVRFVGAGGQPRRLFDLSTGPHWTLLGCHADRNDFAPRRNLRIHATGPQGDLLDPEGNFSSTYGVAQGDWVLIRPDGYIGAIADAGQERMLDEHMCGIGLAGVPVA